MGGMTTPPSGPSAPGTGAPTPNTNFFGAPVGQSAQNEKSTPPQRPDMPRSDMGDRYGAVDMGYDPGDDRLPAYQGIPQVDAGSGGVNYEGGDFQQPNPQMLQELQQRRQAMPDEQMQPAVWGQPMQMGEAMQPPVSQSPAGQRMIQSMRKMSMGGSY